MMRRASDLRACFPHRLRVAREAAGLSQAQLAKGSGINPSQISQLEAGRPEGRLPSVENLAALAEALGTTTDALLGLARPLDPFAGLAADSDRQALGYLLARLKTIPEAE